MRSPSAGRRDLLEVTLMDWDWKAELNSSYSGRCPAPGRKGMCSARVWNGMGGCDSPPLWGYGVTLWDEGLICQVPPSVLCLDSDPRHNQPSTPPQVVLARGSA